MRYDSALEQLPTWARIKNFQCVILTTAPDQFADHLFVKTSLGSRHSWNEALHHKRFSEVSVGGIL